MNLLFNEFLFFSSQNQFNTSVCSNVSFSTEGNRTDEFVSHRSSSVRFKENEIERSDSARVQPLWRSAYEADTEAPQYRSVKPILTPGRSSAISGASPLPPSEFEKPQRFTTTNEQLDTISREYHVLKPKPVSARPFSQSKPFSSDSIESKQFYTATAGPPFHNQKNAERHMEMRETSESSQHIVTSMKKVVTMDEHHSHSSFEKTLEPFPFAVSPTSSMARQKFRPPPTPTKFIPGEFRESDYDSEIEAMKIRPLWTPNPTDADGIYYRHVSPPTPSRCVSVPRHHFERILTPMDFDTNSVEMPSQIKCISSPSPPFIQQPAHFKTQTLDRFRSKKKVSSHFGQTSQDDISIMRSTPKYSRTRSPVQSYREQSRASQYGKLKFTCENCFNGGKCMRFIKPSGQRHFFQDFLFLNTYHEFCFIPRLELIRLNQT